MRVSQVSCLTLLCCEKGEPFHRRVDILGRAGLENLDHLFCRWRFPQPQSADDLPVNRSTDFLEPHQRP